jgi:hypothetical protein
MKSQGSCRRVTGLLQGQAGAVASTSCICAANGPPAAMNSMGIPSRKVPMVTEDHGGACAFTLPAQCLGLLRYGVPNGYHAIYCDGQGRAGTGLGTLTLEPSPEAADRGCCMPEVHESHDGECAQRTHEAAEHERIRPPWHRLCRDVVGQECHRWPRDHECPNVAQAMSLAVQSNTGSAGWPSRSA